MKNNFNVRKHMALKLFELQEQFMIDTVFIELT